MKQLVRYKLNFKSKWLTLSGVMMGIAFFLQALDFFALRQLQGVSIWELLLLLILPMTLEACWCVLLRTEKWGSAQVYGIIAALICLVLLGQAVLTGGVFPIVLASVFFVLGGAAAVLITFGFIPHRALGLLVFAAIAVVQALVFVLPQYLSGGYMTLVQQIPPVCMTLGLLMLYGGLHMQSMELTEE